MSLLGVLAQGNRIGSEGLFALSTALMSNTSLKEIVLTDNAIGSVSEKPYDNVVVMTAALHC